MDVEFAFLADAAQVEGGKLYVLGGGFDRIFAPSFPAKHALMCLVVKIRVHPVEWGREHKLEIELWDTDGKRLGQLYGNFSVSDDQQDRTRDHFVQLVFNLVMQEFAKPGAYAFHIVIDNTRAKTLALYLQETEQSAPSGRTKPK